jgi:tetratricopeptide (TPR) repeat protein
MREARAGSGLTFAAFARQAGYGQAHLRSVENGNRSVTPEVAAAYDRVLRNGELFTRELAAATLMAGDASWDQQGTLQVLAELVGGRRVDRRGLITAGLALAASAKCWSTALAATGPADTPPAAAPPNVPRLLAHMNDRLAHLRYLDDELGSGTVHELARTELSLAVTLIRARRYPEPVVDRLHGLAAEAARQAAWSAFDQHRFGPAQRYFDASLRASVEARDPVAGAYTLSFAAIQCYSTPGESGQAVALLDAARTHVKGKSTPRMDAMLAARTARALSKAGAQKEAAHQLHLARAALDKGPRENDPKVLYWVDDGEIEMIAGSCALELGDPAEALRRFEAALDASYPGDAEYPRSHAIYLSRAAEAHLAMRDLDAAIAKAQHAAACLGSVDSARSASELKGLRTKLTEHASYPPVRDFLEAG